MYTRTCPAESRPSRRLMTESYRPNLDLTRRASLRLLAGAMTPWSAPAQAQGRRAAFAQWVASFRPRALARGVSDASYTRVLCGLSPDTSVYALDRSEPEIT